MGSFPSSVRDRLEALRRSKSYRDDFTKWKRLVDQVKHTHKVSVTSEVLVSEKYAHNANIACQALVRELKSCEARIQHKWKIGPSFPPPIELMTTSEFLRLEKKKTKKKTKRTILPGTIAVRGNPFTDENIRVLNPDVLHPAHGSLTPSLIAKGFDGFEPFRVTYDYESVRKKAPKGPLKAASTRGKHLCLVIDLSAPVKELVVALGKHLKRNHRLYRSMLPKRTRNKPTRDIKDIWSVYDGIKSGMTVAKMSSPVFKKKRGDITIEHKKQAALSAVRRAFNKAEKLISLVEQQANS